MIGDEKTIQLNDFSKGMNADTSDVYLDNGAYRLANNLRYVTNTGENSGELHMIEGATFFAQLEGEGIDPNNIKVKAVTQLRDRGIIVTEGAGKNDWLVWVVKKGINTLNCVADIINGDKDRVVGKRISVVTRFEDSDNQKLYIADGAGPIMVVLLTERGEDQTTVDAQTETNIDRILSYPSALLEMPKFSGLLSGGHLKAGLISYSYRLYKKHGSASEISVPTKLIPLHLGSILINGLVKGYEAGKETDKGIKVSIEIASDLVAKFDSLQLYRITYVEAGLNPTIEVIYDDKFTLEGGKFIYSDLGTNALSYMTLEEYNSSTGIHIIPKTIESKDDYMFAAYINGDDRVYNKEVLNEWRDWNVEGNVTYSFITTELIGDLCNYLDRITISAGDTIYKFGTKINAIKFGGSENPNLSDTSGQQITVDLSMFIDELNNDISNYANPYVTYTLKSLRRGETYRYGIIFYNEDGMYSDVKWIGDITAPSYNQSTPFVYKLGPRLPGEGTTSNCLYVKPLGIQFQINLPANVARYEIVRCSRDEADRYTITQCVLSRPIYRVYDAVYDPRTQSGFPLTPTGWITTQDYVSFAQVPEDAHRDGFYNTGSLVGTPFDDFQARGGEKSWEHPEWNEYSYLATNAKISTGKQNGPHFNVDGNYNTFLVISPEFCYSGETTKEFIEHYSNGLKIQPLCYISPFVSDKQSLINFSPASYDDIWGDEGRGTNYVIALYKFGPFAKMRILDEYHNLSSGHAPNGDSETKYALQNTSLDVLAAYYLTDNEIGKTQWLDVDNFKKAYDDKYPNRYSYVKLYNFGEMYDNMEYDINGVAYPQSIAWDEFATPGEEFLLEYNSKKSNAGYGSRSFVNWVAGCMFEIDHNNSVLMLNISLVITDEILNDSSTIVGAMMGPGGKCFIINVGSDRLGGIPKGATPMGTYICNIKHPAVPYNGDSNNSKESSSYRSFGNYFTNTGDSAQIANVFDGDCFIMPFEYISQHKWYHSYLPNNRRAMVAYSIPLETNVNLAYTYGAEFSKNVGVSLGTDIQEEPVDINIAGSADYHLEDPLYVYNGAYSSTPKDKTYIAQSTNPDDYGTCLDYRVFNSKPKSTNENIDSWVLFDPADYLDVDSRYGAITGLRRFHNQLMFWQETAAGILQVNERSLIKDESNLPLILGTGDVLGRFDYLNTSNGMRLNEYADTLSDTTLYWWDHDRREIVAYSDGLLTLIISKVKFVQNILNKYTDEQLRDPKHDVNEWPVLWFDKKFNEAIFTLGEHNEEHLKGSLVYNEHLAQFTSMYNVKPVGAIAFSDSTLIVTDKCRISKWNVIDMDKGALNEEGDELLPYLKYIVNKNSMVTKVYDNGEMAGRIYGGSDSNNRTYQNSNPLEHLTLTFGTPLKQHSLLSGNRIDNREYNFTYVVPRNFENGTEAEYGGRMRGKTMQVELESDTNDYDFSLQFVINKYRISWA